MESRLRCPQWYAERAGDLLEWHAEEVMEDDDRPKFGIEVAKRLLDLVAIGDRRGEVAVTGGVDRGQFDLDRPAPPAAHDVDARMDDEPAKPGIESVRVAQRRQRSPGADISILDAVARELRVPKDQAGSRVQPRDRVAGKRREGVMIAPLGSLDEVSLVHDNPRSRRGRSVALRWYAVV